MKSENRHSKSPVRESFMGDGGWRVIAATLFGMLAGHAVVWYTGQFYALFFLQTILKVPLASAYPVVIAALVLGAPFFVFFGWLSDKVGRKPILMTGLLLASLSYYPLYRWMAASVNPFQPVTLTFIVLLQVIFAAMATGPLGAFLVDSFPPKVRYTSVSFVHHSGTGWFGGSLPLIATAVVAKTGNIYAGLVYPIVVAFTAFLIGMVFVREQKGE